MRNHKDINDLDGRIGNVPGGWRFGGSPKGKQSVIRE
jgi:hypothetical protein